MNKPLTFVAIISALTAITSCSKPGAAKAQGPEKKLGAAGNTYSPSSISPNLAPIGETECQHDTSKADETVIEIKKLNPHGIVSSMKYRKWVNGSYQDSNLGSAHIGTPHETKIDFVSPVTANSRYAKVTINLHQSLKATFPKELNSIYMTPLAINSADPTSAQAMCVKKKFSQAYPDGNYGNSLSFFFLKPSSGTSQYLYYNIVLIVADDQNGHGDDYNTLVIVDPAVKNEG